MRSVIEQMGLAPDGATAGTPQLVQEHVNKYVQIVKGAGAISVAIDGTIDGVTYTECLAAQAAGGIFAIPQTVKKIRVRAHASMPDATGGVWYMALDARTDV